MKSLKRVLLPTDLSGKCENLIRVAALVAGEFHSEISLLHVIPDIKGSPVSLDSLKTDATKALSDLRDELLRRGVSSIKTAVNTGTAFDQITEYADQQDAGVIIMGNGRKENTDRFQLGLTAEKVIRKSTKPVWVVKEIARRRYARCFARLTSQPRPDGH